ncbi:Hypothetical_protein [Hexamita inflata]|uniref:Hypothetical_protein n=1 Tax=Hexamita inflata TaxID=28002 RepID=A0ABP1HZN2_9EUKA
MSCSLSKQNICNEILKYGGTYGDDRAIPLVFRYNDCVREIHEYVNNIPARDYFFLSKLCCININFNQCKLNVKQIQKIWNVRNIMNGQLKENKDQNLVKLTIQMQQGEYRSFYLLLAKMKNVENRKNERLTNDRSTKNQIIKHNRYYNVKYIKIC